MIRRNLFCHLCVLINRVVLLLCGGNIDTSVLGRCLDRGLAIDGRLVKFHATLSDRPGGIAELCRILATISVCVKDIIHERAWLSDDVFSVRVSVVYLGVEKIKRRITLLIRNGYF